MFAVHYRHLPYWYFMSPNYLQFIIMISVRYCTKYVSKLDVINPLNLRNLSFFDLIYLLSYQCLQIFPSSMVIWHFNMKLLTTRCIYLSLYLSYHAFLSVHYNLIYSTYLLYWIHSVVNNIYIILLLVCQWSINLWGRPIDNESGIPP